MRDPTKITNALRSLQGFYGLRGVTCYSDPTLEAEALGCELDWTDYPPQITKRPSIDSITKSRVDSIVESGRIPIVLEVIKRLNIMLSDVILLVTITGPLTLARYLSGDESSAPDREILNLAASVTLELTRSFGEAGLDIPLIREEQLQEWTDETIPSLKRIYAPIWNTARFYGMQPILSVKKAETDKIPYLYQVADCVTVNDSHLLSDKSVKRVAFTLPVDSLADSPEAIRTRLEKDLPESQLETGKIVIATTDEEIPLDIDREALIAGMKTVQAYVGPD